MEEEYPEHVAIDFRKLTTRALLNYISHHGIGGISTDFTQPKLANLVARHFNSWKLKEESVIESFCANVGLSWNGRYLGQVSAGMNPRGFGEKSNSAKQNISHPKKRKHPPTATGPTSQSNKKNRHRNVNMEPARRGEQVAAKVNSSEENGAWILARVVEYSSVKQVYTVQDEDDASKVMELKYTDVLRLNNSTGNFMKGDRVLAMFPETTSFYRGVVSKSSSMDEHKSKTIVVKFEDDEDETGRTPSRHIPMRYVLRVPNTSPPISASKNEEYEVKVEPSFAEVQTGKLVTSLQAMQQEDLPGVPSSRETQDGLPERNLKTISHNPSSSTYTRHQPHITYAETSNKDHLTQDTQHQVHQPAANSPNPSDPQSYRSPQQPSSMGHQGVLPTKINTAGKGPGEITYSDMITQALNHLPEKRGNFKEICSIIERQFTKQLNWKLESSAMRKTPIW
eukprot:CAMPEP_0117755704 /NCGR_PEP_ID=MMETSP0947-20121206/13611_1 /TAXON_ID=44440 /ORGANISM="Chattonella subsalsa, Strain CCMP2191" /LENGTH=452 /DNA_ID=CAMNT_0005575091 /DNA_START=199 /DNA_END=1554 /DNA_ORIENTATION=+